jgi:hypothetical protein
VAAILGRQIYAQNEPICFAFYVRDIKKMKAQICAENGSNLKSNLSAEQQKAQSNLNEKA